MSNSSNASPGEQRSLGRPEDRLARLLGRLAAQRWLRMQAAAGQQPTNEVSVTRMKE